VTRRERATRPPARYRPADDFGLYAPFDFDVRDGDGPTGETITVRPYVGWTTDEAKATAAGEAGATVREYRSKDPQFSGWEVSVRERVEPS
jgi:hypothetical protein